MQIFKPFELDFATLEALTPETVPTLNALYGEELTMSFRHFLAYNFLQRFVAQGKISSAGRWRITISSENFNIKAHLEMV